MYYFEYSRLWEGGVDLRSLNRSDLSQLFGYATDGSVGCTIEHQDCSSSRPTRRCVIPSQTIGRSSPSAWILNSLGSILSELAVSLRRVDLVSVTFIPDGRCKRWIRGVREDIYPHGERACDRSYWRGFICRRMQVDGAYGTSCTDATRARVLRGSNDYEVGVKRVSSWRIGVSLKCRAGILCGKPTDYESS